MPEVPHLGAVVMAIQVASLQRPVMPQVKVEQEEGLALEEDQVSEVVEVMVEVQALEADQELEEV